MDQDQVCGDEVEPVRNWGAGVCVTSKRKQMDEVRSGGSHISQNDLRVHFGLGKAEAADVEIRWPSGAVQKLPGLAANRIYTVVEGQAL